MKNLKEQFKESTGLSHEATGIFCDCDTVVDVWNDKYIVWLESRLNNLLNIIDNEKQTKWEEKN